MIFHLSVSGVNAGTMDLDKKMPSIKTIYPEASISKKVEPIDCIKIEGINKNIKLTKLFDKEIDIDINLDLYALSMMSYTYCDIYFEIDIKLYDLLCHNMGAIWNLIFHSKINLFGEEKGFASIITQVLMPYYNFDQAREIRKTLSEESLFLDKNIDRLFKETGVRFYCIDGPATDIFNAGPMAASIMIEDYNNEISIKDDNWEIITPLNDAVYFNADEDYYICKREDYYKHLFEYVLLRTRYLSRMRFIKQGCKIFLNVIRKKGLSIRKNIIENHQNPYYWKGLKNEIEILDLNFLEFHADAILGSITFRDDLPMTKNFRDVVEGKFRMAKEDMMSYLNEVKYSISNLSTPSHVHDEAILQVETEKVNDRILMLSFIAMVVSAIGMMQSNDIAFKFKMIYGAAIFSLPVFYYAFRSMHKKLSFRRNRINELIRVIKSKTKSLAHHKESLKTIAADDSLENFPEGFIDEVLEIRKKEIQVAEQTIKNLKKQI